MLYLDLMNVLYRSKIVISGSENFINRSECYIDLKLLNLDLNDIYRSKNVISRSEWYVDLKL